MTVRVYHVRPERFAAAVRGETFPLDEYIPVADVATHVLGTAYMRTNHIDSDWTTGSGVVLLEPIYGQPTKGPANHRSTSVGDLMEHDGHFYRVAPVGFEPYRSPS